MRRTRHSVTFLWFVPALLACLPCAGLPQGTSLAAVPGYGKILEPSFLERDLQSPGDVTGVVVLLEGYAQAAELVRADQPGEMGRQQEAIAARLDRFLSTVPEHWFQPTVRFRNFPGLAGLATREGVELLVGREDVAVLYEDSEAQAQLAEGIPLINAMNARAQYDGSGLSVGIIDTGILYTHEKLGNAGFPNSKVIGGWNFDPNATDPTDPVDCRFHGTRVAGVAAGEEAAGPGSYIGGVAPNARLYALKVTQGCTGGTNVSLIAAAIDWAVTHKNDDPANPILVLNMSLGGQYRQTVCDAQNPATATAAGMAVANGITLVAASGNNGFCDAIAHPACLSDVISVGAVYDAAIGNLSPCIDSRSCIGFSAGGCGTGWACRQTNVFADLVTCYTNSADILDILAPSNNAHTTDVNGGYFPTFSGTSCASPYAAGAAAVLQSWAIATQGAPLAPSEIRDILVTYGDPVEDPKNGLIRPRINLGNFLDAGEDCNDGVDNDGDGDVDCDDFDCQVDSDGDTVLDPPCGTDCDIDDDTVWTVPADPTRLRWLDRNTIAWTAPDYGAGGASAFQLVQGRLEELPVGSGPAEQCLDPAIGDVQATDPTLPASGDRFYYLVRGTNACIAADHPYGQDSVGGQRTTAACP